MSTMQPSPLHASLAHTVVTVKQHDNVRTIWRASVDLTGATTRLLARRPNAPKIELAHTVIDAYTVEHITDGTLPVADYLVELEITRGGERITAPTDHYEHLVVITDLD